MLLRRISMQDRSAKTIVFSQWQGVLQIVSVGLVTNEISFADAFSKGGRQQDKEVQNFKASSDVNVLLLATKSGANGLNLTEATNVVLVEPVMSPAVEAQAVSRVLRIGQTKDTHVYRLIVKGTIEEKIVKMQQSRRVAPSSAKEVSPAKVGAHRDGTPRRGRRGTEDHLTVADLRGLFAGHIAGDTTLQTCASGGSSTASAIDLSTDSEHGQAISHSSKVSFWTSTVLYNRRDVPRTDAANAIEML
jgi:superfamily II DNA or RNA helicase